MVGEARRTAILAETNRNERDTLSSERDKIQAELNPGPLESRRLHYFVKADATLLGPNSDDTQPVLVTSAGINHIASDHHQDVFRRDNEPPLRRSQDGAYRLGFDRRYFCLLYLASPQPTRKGEVDGWRHQSGFHRPTPLDQSLNLRPIRWDESSHTRLLDGHCVQQVPPARMVGRIRSATTFRRLWSRWSGGWKSGRVVGSHRRDNFYT